MKVPASTPPSSSPSSAIMPPLVGLEYIAVGEKDCICHLCGTNHILGSSTALAHIVCYKHRYNYMRAAFPLRWDEMNRPTRKGEGGKTKTPADKNTIMNDF